MPRNAYTTVVDIAAEQQGYVTQQDARGAGIAATTLARMAERGTLVRTSHGVYRVPLIPAGPLDQYREATLWPRGARGVLSNETALSLYELSDANPAKIHITVPRAHRPQRATPTLYVVHRADLRDDEITAYEGHPDRHPGQGDPGRSRCRARPGPDRPSHRRRSTPRRPLARAGSAARRRDRRRALSPASRQGPVKVQP